MKKTIPKNLLDIEFFGYENRDFSLKVFSEDFLKCDAWEFYIATPIELRLMCFSSLSRPSRRHGFLIERNYYRLGRPMGIGIDIKLEDVPLTEELKQLALNAYVEHIGRLARVVS